MVTIQAASAILFGLVSISGGMVQELGYALNTSPIPEEITGSILILNDYGKEHVFEILDACRMDGIDMFDCLRPYAVEERQLNETDLVAEGYVPPDEARASFAMGSEPVAAAAITQALLSFGVPLEDGVPATEGGVVDDIDCCPNNKNADAYIVYAWINPSNNAMSITANCTPQDVPSFVCPGFSGRVKSTYVSTDLTNIQCEAVQLDVSVWDDDAFGGDNKIDIGQAPSDGTGHVTALIPTADNLQNGCVPVWWEDLNGNLQICNEPSGIPQPLPCTLTGQLDGGGSDDGYLTPASVSVIGVG